MILHTVNKSPFNSRCLKQCISRCSDSDAILLIEDGVYALPTIDSFAIDKSIKVYALVEDLQIRGIAEQPSSAYSCINYGQWVKLCTQYNSVMAWY